MIIIRRIRASDATAFREVLDSVCKERKFLAALEAPALPRVEEFVSSNVEKGLPQFVACDGEKLVGWCDVLPGDAGAGTAHVGQMGMGVLRDFRGRGIGGRLLEDTLGMAREIGLEKIELSVYASNGAAMGLYRKAGFVEEGRKVKGRLIDGMYDDVILMALALKP